jgi:hypothetical protein
MPVPVQHSSELDALCSHSLPQYCQGGYRDSLAGSAALLHCLLRDVHYPGPGDFGLNRAASSVGVARMVMPLSCLPNFVWATPEFHLIWPMHSSLDCLYVETTVVNLVGAGCVPLLLMIM